MVKKSKEIFKVRDVLGNSTILWKHALQHILLRHPNSGIFIEKIKETITNPDLVTEDKYNAFLFYKKLDPRHKEIMGTTNDYLPVVSKRLRSFRFILSSYPVPKPKLGDKIIWPKQKPF